MKYSLFMALFILSSASSYGQRSIRSSTQRPNQRHIVFLLDVSNSMGRDNKTALLKSSAEALLPLLEKQDKVSLLTFGSMVNLIYSSTNHHGSDSLLRIISKIRSSASATNINQAVYEAYDLLDNDEASDRHVLLITDGEFILNAFTRSLVERQQQIRMTGVVVGKGVSAEKAVQYIRDELCLPVVTLVDEEKDAEKLIGILKKQP